MKARTFLLASISITVAGICTGAAAHSTLIAAAVINFGSAFLLAADAVCETIKGK